MKNYRFKLYSAVYSILIELPFKRKHFHFFKAILKNLKDHLIKLCTHEYGHLLVLAIVNSMDDTKGLKKSIFDPILAQIEFISSNEWGRKVRSYIIKPVVSIKT